MNSQKSTKANHPFSAAGNPRPQDTRPKPVLAKRMAKRSLERARATIAQQAKAAGPSELRPGLCGARS